MWEYRSSITRLQFTGHHAPFGYNGKQLLPNDDLARVSRALNYEFLLFYTAQFGGLRPPSPLGFIDLETICESAFNSDPLERKTASEFNPFGILTSHDNFCMGKMGMRPYIQQHFRLTYSIF
jgi:hypothetical protein